ncbi:MAG: gliding motility-associated C-terminal domain-containing protein, partial [Flavobacteriales bacterium]
PKFKCVSVNGSKAELGWQKVSDPNNKFHSYVLYEANNPGGPFSVLDTIHNINQTTYTHTGADVDLGSRSYYLKTLSGCGGRVKSKPSDTLNSLFLEVKNQNDGIAELKWNELNSPPEINSSYGWYRIYKEKKNGSWSLYDSVRYETNQYNDTIKVCEDSINYKVEIGDASGCVSTSNIDNDLFKDRIAPTPPVIKSLSVDTSDSKAELCWRPSPEGDTEGYIILKITDAGDKIIDTVYGKNNTCYKYPLSNAGNEVEEYAVAAFDSCWTGNPPSPNTSIRGDIHNTMHLKTKSLVCERAIELNWNPYINWKSGVDHYEIYKAFDDGSLKFLGIRSENETTFKHKNIQNNQKNCYIVRAVSANGYSASSNKGCKTVEFPPVPQFNYLRAATVQKDSNVRLRILVDTTAKIGGYNIERKIAGNSASFKKIGELSSPNEEEKVVNYIDKDVKPSNVSYKYRVIVKDSCGNAILTSNIGKTILLEVKAYDDKEIMHLSWSDYKEWNGNIVKYNIYRRVDDKFNPTPIAQVPANKNSYRDDISEFIEKDGKFCYYIEAVESKNSFGFSEKSRSNISCDRMPPLVFIPNAFKIQGNTETFGPKGSYIRRDGFQMKIYNRWGELVFKSESPDNGWKGKKNGEFVKQGVYVYSVKYLDDEGQPIIKKGHVTILK